MTYKSTDVTSHNSSQTGDHVLGCGPYTFHFERQDREKVSGPHEIIYKAVVPYGVVYVRPVFINYGSVPSWYNEPDGWQFTQPISGYDQPKIWSRIFATLPRAIASACNFCDETYAKTTPQKDPGDESDHKETQGGFEKVFDNVFDGLFDEDGGLVHPGDETGMSSDPDINDRFDYSNEFFNKARNYYGSVGYDAHYHAILVLVEDCHNAAKEVGWWDQPRPVPEMIALMHSELSEMLEGDRKDTFDDHLPHRSSVEVEAADLLIRLMDFAGGQDLDIAGAYLEKRAYNATRADHKRENRTQAGGKKY